MPKSAEPEKARVNAASSRRQGPGAVAPIVVEGLGFAMPSTASPHRSRLEIVALTSTTGRKPRAGNERGTIAAILAPRFINKGQITMAASAKSIVVDPGTEIARLLQQAEDAPLVIVSNGSRYRLIREDSAEQDLFAGYDPAAVQAALDGMFGVLKGVDAAALKAELRAQRDQDSSGRPA